MTVTKKLSRIEKKRRQTKTEIIAAAEQLFFQEGPQALTIARIADVLGFTKPAIYYYYPSKDALLHALILKFVYAEYEFMYQEISKAQTGPDALETLIRSFCTYYLKHLDQFRLVYLMAQVQGSDITMIEQPVIAKEINPLSQRVFGLVESKLQASLAKHKPKSDVHPRRLGVSAHMSAMGLVTMIGLTEAMNDPLLHKTQDLIDELCVTYRQAAGG